MGGARHEAVHPAAASTTVPIVVATELRAHVLEGTAWVPRAFAHDYWSTFLGEPRSTIVVLRGDPVLQVSPDLAPLEGSMVRALVLPPLGPKVSLPTDVGRAIKRLWQLDETGILVLRMPGVVGTLVLLVALARGRRFAVQMVGDPLDVAFKAGIGGRLGRVAGLVLAGTAALACRRASATSYVTDRYLQTRYPPRSGVAARAIANVVLDPHPVERARISGREVSRLVTVASLEQPYKRLDLLIDAVATLRGQGWPIELSIAGGGRLLDSYRQQAAEAGLDGVVTFHGMLDHPDVLALVASADLFVLCSDTEGMPRAMIEAMAAGTPCVGSAVGGILELLPPYALFEPGSVNSLVAAISRHLWSPRLRARSSREMLRRANDFAPHRLEVLRAQFVEDLSTQVGGGRRRRCIR